MKDRFFWDDWVHLFSAGTRIRVLVGKGLEYVDFELCFPQTSGAESLDKTILLQTLWLRYSAEAEKFKLSPTNLRSELISMYITEEDLLFAFKESIRH